ncbi:MAG: type II toxin-antitoxin system HicA family toxin [Nitrospiraceae bacterium]|nr:MAG: type II toxin-antitoxin system HicA family toxin [Nitrospiraceae bacterium]
MGKYDKLLLKILRGASDADISFSELCHLLKKFGFNERIRGDHHIFTRDGIEEILNLQPKGSKAKQYQVKQVRNLMVKYKLQLEEKGEK